MKRDKLYIILEIITS